MSSYELIVLNVNDLIITLRAYIQELLSLVREELMSQRKSEPDRYDPTQPPYEAYKVDFDLFRILFGGLSPWGKCTQAESLSARLFRVSYILTKLLLLL